MAVTTVNYPNVPSRKVAWIPYGIAASTHIYAGDNVAVNGSGDLVQATDASGQLYVGQSRAEVNNTGSAGALTVDVDPPFVVECVEFDCTSPTKAMLQQIAYFIDNHTVATSGSTNSIVAGVIIQILNTATTGRVMVDVRRKT